MKVAEVETSGRVVLGCGCGERIVLLGREGDWRGEGRLSFPCAGCGGEVGLGERAEEAKEARSGSSIDTAGGAEGFSDSARVEKGALELGEENTQETQ